VGIQWPKLIHRFFNLVMEEVGCNQTRVPLLTHPNGWTLILLWD
jgi:hypothetical protein